ncbi:MAG: hypothetical protein ACTH5N_03780 [Psychroflexus halocasei]
MKKLLLILSAVACFSFGCPENSSAISSSCWSGCVSVNVELTGDLGIDAGNASRNFLRKPTPTEFAEAQEILDGLCAN